MCERARVAEQRHSTSIHSRPDFTVLHELPSAQMGQDYLLQALPGQGPQTLKASPSFQGHGHRLSLDRQMHSCSPELWGTMPSQALLTSSLGLSFPICAQDWCWHW